jgi:hypothetical protein
MDLDDSMSGMSTWVSQMRIFYGEGFSMHDRELWRGRIFSNIVYSCLVIFQARRDRQIDFEYELNNCMTTSGSLLAHSDNRYK